MTDTLQDTLNKVTEQENEGLIQEALRDAKLTDAPSELRSNPVIHKGDTALEAPMTLKELTHAGYVYIWDSRTYKRAPVLYYMLPQKLRERREDGSYIWTIKDPGELPTRGTLKCMLHKDDINRKDYDAMGLRVCKKDNITNAFEVKQHMLKKHPKEWKVLEDVKKEKERQEDRDAQKSLYEAIGSKKEEEPLLYVSKKDKLKK